MKPNWFRNMIAGLSFTSALFIFQSCYGTPQDFLPDVKIEGKVISKTSGNPIEGVKVSVARSSQYEHTDAGGRFSFYTEASDLLTIRFEDIDNEENGLFADRDTVLQDVWEPVYMDIEMVEK